MTNSHTEYKNAENKTFYEVFPEKDFTSSIIIVNGDKVSPNYRLKKGDIATIRFFPEGGLATSAIVSIVGWSILGATVVGGIIAWHCSPEFRSWVKGLFIDNDSNKEEKEDVLNVSGVSNSSGKGKPVPIILGENLISPNYWGQFYTELDPETSKGKKRISHVLYNLGYNDIEVKDIKLKYTSLSSNKENKESGKLVIDSTSFNSVKDTIELELQKTEEVSNYPQRVIQQDFGTEIQKIVDHEAVPIQFVTATNPMKLEVEIGFNGLYKMDDDGDKQKHSVTLKCEYRDGGDNGVHTVEDKEPFAEILTDWIDSSFENETKDVIPVIEELLKKQYPGYDFYKPKGSLSFDFNINDERVLLYEFDADWYAVKYYNKEKQGWIGKYHPISSAKYHVKCYRKITSHESWKTIDFKGDGVTRNDDGSFTFRQNDINEMRFVARKEFSYSDVSYMIEKTSENFIQVRITRISDNATDSKFCDKVYLSSVRTWSFNPDKSKEEKVLIPQAPINEEVKNLSCRIGFQIEANEALKEQIESFNCIVKSKAPYWISAVYNEDGDLIEEGHWAVDSNGNFITRAENNPASLTLMVMRHPSLKENKIPLKKINLIKLGELYEFCEYAGYTCNMIVSSQVKLGDLIYKILACGHAFPVLDDNQYSFIIDHEQQYPTMIVNNRNILSKGLKNSKDFEELPDRLRVKFIDKDMNYQENEIDVWVDDTMASNPPVNPKTENVTFEGITNNIEAWRRGKYELAKRIARPETWVRNMSVDGALIGVGDMFEIQDDTILVGIGDGACIDSFVRENGAIVGFNADARVYFEPDVQLNEGDSYGVKIVHADGLSDPAVKTFKLANIGAGNTNYFEFETPIMDDDFIPAVGDACAFGVFGKITQKALCLAKKGNDDGTYEITAVPYNEDVYVFDNPKGSYKMPEFFSNVTRPVSGNFGADLPADNITREEFDEAIGNIQPITLRYLKLSSYTTKKVDDVYTTVNAYAMSKTGSNDEETFEGFFEVIGGTLSASSGTMVKVQPTDEECIVYLKASEEGDVIDRLTITEIKDGEKGEKGDAGKNEYLTFDLKENELTIYSDKNGNVHKYQSENFVICYYEDKQFFGAVNTEELRRYNADLIRKYGFEFEVNNDHIIIKCSTGSYSPREGKIAIPFTVDADFTLIDADGDVIGDDDGFVIGNGEITDNKNYIVYCNYKIVVASSNYFGTSQPENPVVGDFYTDSESGQLLEWKVNPTTSELEWMSCNDSSKQMQALSDMIDCNPDSKDAGYFVNLFAKRLMALQATVDELIANKIASQSFSQENKVGFAINGSDEDFEKDGEYIPANTEIHYGDAIYDSDYIKTSATAPCTSLGYQSGFRYTDKGEWKPNVIYNRNDKVLYDGITYVLNEQFSVQGLTPDKGQGWEFIGSVIPTSTAIGMKALSNNTKGTDNTALGACALESNTNGSYNTALGASALRNMDQGVWNTAVGAGAMVGTVAAEYNTAVGVNALAKSRNGYNTAVGVKAGSNIDYGTDNVAIGFYALADDNKKYRLQNCIGIGSEVQPSSQFIDNNIILGNKLIYLEFTHGIHTYNDVYKTLLPYLSYSTVTGSKRQIVSCLGYYGANPISVLRDNTSNIGIYNGSSNLLSVSNVSTLLTEDLVILFINTNISTNLLNQQRPFDKVATAWISGTSYNINDVVTYNGYYYVCITATSSAIPLNTTYWIKTDYKVE